MRSGRESEGRTVSGGMGAVDLFLRRIGMIVVGGLRCGVGAPLLSPHADVTVGTAICKIPNVPSVVKDNSPSLVGTHTTMKQVKAA